MRVQSAQQAILRRSGRPLAMVASLVLGLFSCVRSAPLPSTGPPTHTPKPLSRAASAGLRPFRAGAECTGPGIQGPAVICVDSRNRRPSPDGGNMSPFSSIAAAIAAAKSGDRILVASGEYREELVIEGKSLRIHGGARGAAAYNGQAVGDFSRAAAAGAATVVRGRGANVVLKLLEARDTRIEGLRIARADSCRSSKSAVCRGRGVFVRGGRPTLAYNVIEGHDLSGGGEDGERSGAALAAEDSHLTLIGNLVRANRSDRGAIATGGGRTELRDNRVIDNVAVGSGGGGLYLHGSIRTAGNRVAANRATVAGAWGGGFVVYGADSRADMRYDVITDNLAAGSGSGLALLDGARARLSNVLIYGNRCGEAAGSALLVEGGESGGSRAELRHVTVAAKRCSGPAEGALYVVNGSRLALDHSVVNASGGRCVNSDRTSMVQARYSLSAQPLAGPGNRTAMPLFVDPVRDLHLRSRRGRWDSAKRRWEVDRRTSPGVNHGDPQSAASAAALGDPDGANLGAYGATEQASR